MQRPHHGDGVVITGALTVDPPLDEDQVDLLDTVQVLSLRASVGERRSAVLEQLAPGHPEGPSGWTTCEEGCCLELDEGGYTRIDAIEPWLAHIVETMFGDHHFEGHLVWWDTVDRTFTAIGVEEGRVSSRPILDGPADGQEAPRSAAPGSDRRRLRGV